MRFLFFVIFAIFFSGCSSVLGIFTNQPVSKDAKQQYNAKIAEENSFVESGKRILLINSPMIRYHEYITFSVDKKQRIKIQLFYAGKELGTIEIRNNRVCILDECHRKWPIAKRFFGKVSYGDLFNDILFGEDIFGGIGKVIIPNGNLVQRFEMGGELIFYERGKNHILFKNLTNGMTLRLDKYIEQKVAPEDE